MPPSATSAEVTNAKAKAKACAAFSRRRRPFRAKFWERIVAPGRDIALSSMIHGAFWSHLLNDRPLSDADADAEGLARKIFIT